MQPGTPAEQAAVAPRTCHATEVDVDLMEKFAGGPAVHLHSQQGKLLVLDEE
jgi:hypothetical protein